MQLVSLPRSTPILPLFFPDVDPEVAGDVWDLGRFGGWEGWVAGGARAGRGYGEGLGDHLGRGLFGGVVGAGYY